MLCALSVVSELLEHSTPVMYAELVSYRVRGFNRHYCGLYGAVYWPHITGHTMREIILSGIGDRYLK